MLAGGKEKPGGSGRWKSGASQKTQKQWKQSQEVIENKGTHVFMWCKTNPKRRDSWAQMRALDPKTNSFRTYAFQPPDSTDGVRQGAKLSGREKAEAARKLEKSWEQSQGVLENKGHDFLKCCN